MPQADLNDIALFVKVIDKGGFAKAAREVHLPTSTVSRAVARLEETMGARLIHRTTRSVSATEEGRTLYERSARPLLELEAAARAGELGRGQPKGTLRLTAPNDLGTAFLADAIVEFTARYPAVSVDMVLSNRTVNLVEEGFDLAVRAGSAPSASSAIARKITSLESELFAAPGYVERHGVPSKLADLAKHSLVLFRPRDGVSQWKLWGPDGAQTVEARGRIGCDDFNFVRSAVLAGGGVALLPRIIVAQDLAAGRLVRVLPRYESRGAALYLLYPSARQLPARVSAFRDFLTVQCSKHWTPGAAAQ
ncbi:MAG TPA: LysR family transcriptional regulator [Polyangiaceae bacterium]|nr:LysR family transcriptional regulator [Vicinamibacterales bacterium]HVJ14440.1 LysR family transcriptional regulator [Polyangiaceae bacterium]